MSEYLGILLGLLAATTVMHVVAVKGAGIKVFGHWKVAVEFFFAMYLIGFAWDRLAVERGHWSFDPDMVTGWWGGLPVEEHLFFLIVPYFIVVFLALWGTIRRPSC